MPPSRALPANMIRSKHSRSRSPSQAAVYCSNVTRSFGPEDFASLSLGPNWFRGSPQRLRSGRCR